MKDLTYKYVEKDLTYKYIDERPNIQIYLWPNNCDFSVEVTCGLILQK